MNCLLVAMVNATCATVHQTVWFLFPVYTHCSSKQACLHARKCCFSCLPEPVVHSFPQCGGVKKVPPTLFLSEWLVWVKCLVPGRQAAVACLLEQCVL